MIFEETIRALGMLCKIVLELQFKNFTFYILLPFNLTRRASKNIDRDPKNSTKKTTREEGYIVSPVRPTDRPTKWMNENRPIIATPLTSNKIVEQKTIDIGRGARATRIPQRKKSASRASRLTRRCIQYDIL